MIQSSAKAGVFFFRSFRGLEKHSRRMQIPPGIIQDILTRLEAKTLTRCKCVCKAWFNLISSPNFQDSHSSRSQRNLHLLFRTSLSYDNDFGFSYEFFSINFKGGGAGHTTFTVKVDGPIKLVLPSCRGLICFATETRIYLYNPATHRLIALPPSATTMCGFGFGYIPASKCYRVVRFIYAESTRRIECSVLQLQRGAKGSELSWRKLEQSCPYLVDEYSLPAFVQGTIYWKINRNQARRRDNDDILSFNIEEDEFSVIPHPSDWRCTLHPSDWRCTLHNWTQLVNLDDKLYMLQISIPTSNVAIWVHRDHQWHRGKTIDFKGIDPTHVGQILWCIKDDELFFGSCTSHRNHLLLCHIKKRAFKRVLFPFTVNDLVIYWESLFPLGDYSH